MIQKTPHPGEQTLPTHLTQFIGRQRELTEIEERLAMAACRLVTLIGPGGTGKTRLAAEVARRQVDRFPHGVFWVDLQAVTTPDLLATAVADTLALPQASHDSRVALLHALQSKTLLLVLDNFEQLRDDASLLTQLLHGAAGVKLLVTSREALNLQEEWLYPVTGLPIPAETDQDWQRLKQVDAVQLFVARARRVQPAFQPEAERDGILQVCRLVEGMPLALEMAASWARALDSKAIAAEIQRSLNFLTATAQNIPDRHRSIHSIFEHTWAQLAPEEQTAFGQMALFRGGFRREAAEAVAGADLPLLASLVDRSLLRWDANGRYQMHELLRQYAAAHATTTADQLAAARQRHAAYFANFLHQHTGHLLSQRQPEAVQVIAPELDNIRAAWEWMLTNGRYDLINQAVDGLAMFCQLQSKFLEGQRLLSQILQHSPTAPQDQPVLARVLNELGWFHIRLGQFDEAETAFRRCQSIYQEHQMRPPMGHSTDPLMGFSELAIIGGDYETAAALAEAARMTAVAQQNWWNVATANYLLASAARDQGDYRQAKASATAAYAATEQTQDRWFMAYCLYEMGQAAAALGDYAQARQHLTACYNLREAYANSEGMALAMTSLGDIACRQGQFDEAASLFQQSVAIYQQIDDLGGLATAYHGLGRTAVAQQAANTARQHLREALQIVTDIQFTALQLKVLADVGHLLLRVGRVQPGLGLLRFVATHPAAGQETQSMVKRWEQQVKTAVSPTLFAAATPPVDLDSAVSLAMRELLVPVPETAVSPLPAAPPAAAHLLEPLTEREQEILQLIAQGQTNRQIANTLSVVVGTVKSHNNRLFGKLGVANRAQAIVRARELGLIP